MSDKDVNFAACVQGRTAIKDSYQEKIAKAGADFREIGGLFVKSIDQAKRQITALASTPDLDRHDEIVLPEAFRELLPVYMKNPVVITSHQHRLETGHSSVVGSVVRAWIDSAGLWIVVEFAETVLGEEYWQLYSTKKQRAFSIGYIPIESRYEKRDDKTVLVTTKLELLEISCVPVPANRDALSKSKQQKADFVDEKKLLAELRKEDPDFDAKAQEFAEMILGYDSGTEPESDFAKAGCDDDVVDFALLVKGRGR
jgi:HK97 family phage prohead protease